MEKLSILLLALGLFASAHGSDKQQDPETQMTRLEQLAKRIRISIAYKEPLSEQEITSLDAELDVIYNSLGVQGGSPTEKDFTEVQAIKQSLLYALRSPCQRSSSFSIHAGKTNITVAVSEA